MSVQTRHGFVSKEGYTNCFKTVIFFYRVKKKKNGTRENGSFKKNEHKKKNLNIVINIKCDFRLKVVRAKLLLFRATVGTL